MWCADLHHTSTCSPIAVVVAFLLWEGCGLLTSSFPLSIVLAPLSSFVAATTYSYGFSCQAYYLLLFSLPSIVSMMFFARVTPYVGKVVMMLMVLCLLKIVEYRVGAGMGSEA